MGGRWCFFIYEVAEEVEYLLAVGACCVVLGEVFYLRALVGHVAGVRGVAVGAAYFKKEYGVGFADAVGVGYVV